MSRKKAPGSSTTMTLKDFHGGSIPSDLPLPSAPGAIERVPNRSTSWGLRSDHRPKPVSAGALRNFDDKTPFLSSSHPIGLNFDEDERSPLGGGNGLSSRRMISDQTASSLPTSRRTESENIEWIARKMGRTGLSASGFSGEATYRKVASGVCGNAWAKPKETLSITRPLPASLSGPIVASKLTHASAFDKVSSGAWQSNQQSRSCLVSVAGDPKCHDTNLAATNAENNFIANNEILGGRRSFTTSEYEQISSHGLPEIVKIKHLGYDNGGQPALGNVKLEIPELGLSEPAQKAERPKLKLLPRSKPLENQVPPVHVNQVYQLPLNSQHLEVVTKSGITDPLGCDLAESQSRNQEVESPKLNFRWQPHLLFQNVQHVEGDGERQTVFGVDLTRESVLKEPVVGDVSSINGHVDHQTQSLAKQDLPRTDTKLAGSSHRTHVRYTGKTVDIPIDHRIRNDDGRWGKLEKTADSQSGNGRSERWRSHREMEKPLETWRKPVEPETGGSFSGGRGGLPGQSQMPFSRLINPMTSRCQIDGY